MSASALNEKIETMQAHQRGEPIMFRKRPGNGVGWTPWMLLTEDPTWDWLRCRYRVEKPTSWEIVEAFHSGKSVIQQLSGDDMWELKVNDIWNFNTMNYLICKDMDAAFVRTQGAIEK